MSHCHKHSKDFESSNMKTFSFIGQDVVQTFIVPPKIEVIRIKLWGGGGAGGSPDNITTISAGGGGAGGYAEVSVRVKPGESYIVVVGGGGSSALGLPGTAGTDTSVVGNTKLFVATGGAGGQVSSATQAAGGVGGIGFISGEISGFVSQGGTGASQLFGSVSGDGGDATAGGSGGLGVTIPSNMSEAGKLPGGGGGGGSLGFSITGPFLGSPGANGLVNVYYDSPCELKSL